MPTFEIYAGLRWNSGVSASYIPFITIFNKILGKNRTTVINFVRDYMGCVKYINLA